MQVCSCGSRHLCTYVGVLADEKKRPGIVPSFRASTYSNLRCSKYRILKQRQNLCHVFVTRLASLPLESYEENYLKRYKTVAFGQRFVGFLRVIPSLYHQRPRILVPSLQIFQLRMSSTSGVLPSTSTQPYELPANVSHIPGVTDPHLCILDAFRTSIAQRIVEVYPELGLEKVSCMRWEMEVIRTADWLSGVRCC